MKIFTAFATISLLMGPVVGFQAALISNAKKAMASFAVGTTILSNLAILPAEALLGPNNAPDFSTSQLISARSGGRAGGRSSRAPVSRKQSPPTRVIEKQRTTVIQAAPSFYGGGGVGSAVMLPPTPYYAPQPSGLGLALGLNAVSGIAEGMREARQENEIRSTRDQLTEARIKEAEMEARLRQLEQAQTAR